MSTKIEWTDETLNWVNGCTRVTEGCRHCYIERTMPMRVAGRKFDSPETGGTTGVFLFPERVTEPLKWRKPRRVFINSMGDSFHDDVPADLIARAFAVMVACPQHSFQVLTKRHGRMRSLLSSEDFWRTVSVELGQLWKCPPPAPFTSVPRWIWIGVSAEDQRAAAIRLPALEATPAVTRFVSAEPLLGPVDLSPWLPSVHWVICGGESGPGARPMHPDWALSLLDQCKAAGVPYFFKQWGEWCPPDHMPEDTFMSWDVHNGTSAYDRSQPWRVGKHRAGRLLDGRTHDAYPVAVA